MNTVNIAVRKNEDSDVIIQFVKSFDLSSVQQEKVEMYGCYDAYCDQDGLVWIVVECGDEPLNTGIVISR